LTLWRSASIRISLGASGAGRYYWSITDREHTNKPGRRWLRDRVRSRLLRHYERIVRLCLLTGCRRDEIGCSRTVHHPAFQ
jgi:hypothetical protein